MSANAKAKPMVVARLRTLNDTITLHPDHLVVRRGFKTVEHPLTAATVARFDKGGERTETVHRETTFWRWILLGPAALLVKKKRKNVSDTRKVSVRIDGDGWHESLTMTPGGKIEQQMRDFVAKVNHSVAQRSDARRSA